MDMSTYTTQDVVLYCIVCICGAMTATVNTHTHPFYLRSNTTNESYLYQATNLRSTTTTGLCNPCVKCRLGETDLEFKSLNPIKDQIEKDAPKRENVPPHPIKSTKAIKQTLSPVWWETLEATDVLLPDNLAQVRFIIITNIGLCNPSFSPRYNLVRVICVLCAVVCCVRSALFGCVAVCCVSHVCTNTCVYNFLLSSSPPLLLSSPRRRTFSSTCSMPVQVSFPKSA